MRDLTVDIIPHGDQRYPTVGDYTKIGKETHFWISQMTDWRYERLVLIHELIEQTLVQARGIALVDIDAFDMEFEAHRQPGNDDEPGDAPECPYAWEHRAAENIERLVCAELGIPWETYNQAVLEVT